MTNVNHAARLLAQAEADLSAAQALHDTAAEKAQAVRQRLAEKEQRHQELAARRVNGNAAPGDEAELILLSGDIPMLQDALAEVENDIPSIAGQQSAVDQRRQDFDDATRAARLEVLKDKATQADALLCRLMHDIEAAGGGLNLCQLWLPSPTLQRTVDREFPKLFG